MLMAFVYLQCKLKSMTDNIINYLKMENMFERTQIQMKSAT